MTPSILPRRRERPMTCLADAAEMQLPSPTGLYKTWRLSPEAYRRGRKYWEWDYLVDCAERLGVLRPDARALGLGVGREVLMYYFARHCKEVVATDLYSSETEWREANTGALEEIYAASPFEYPRERLKVEVADMRQTHYPGESFDFVWSCGSIEHVPTLFDIYKTFVEIHRLLKPGGYALITTEYCLFEPPYFLQGMNAMDEQLVELFLKKLEGLELTGPTDLTYNCAHPLSAVTTRHYMFAEAWSKTQQYFIPLDYVHMMGLSSIIPIGFVLKKTGVSVAPWDSLPLPAAYRTYAEASNLQVAKEPVEVLKRLLALAEAPRGSINLQFHLQIVSLLVQYMDHDSFAHAQSNMRHLVERFLALMPEGELQDPNLLQNMAYYLLKLGEAERASELLRRAALSPSAFADHALSLALEHMKQKLAANKGINGEDPLPMIMKDLLQHGYSMSWINNVLKTATHVTALPPILTQLCDAVSAQVLSELQGRLK